MNPTYETVSDNRGAFPFLSFWNRSQGQSEWVHPHWHHSVEILQVGRGDALQQINDRNFRISQGDIVCIPSGTVHATTACGPAECCIHVVQYDPTLTSRVEGPSPLVLPTHLRTHEPGHDVCTTDLHALARAWERQGPGVQRICLAHLLLFQAHAEQSNAPQGFGESNPPTSIGASSQAVLTRTFQLIDEEYASPLALATAARASNLSVTHFCRTFRNSTGRSFKEYLTAYRVDKAALRILENSKVPRSISRIAEECGFGSVYSMIRAFHDAYGCSPSEFSRRDVTKCGSDSDRLPAERSFFPSESPNQSRTSP